MHSTLPILELNSNKDDQLMAAMGSIATLAFLRTFIDDQGAIADFVPDGFNPDTL